jgi:hypothetical protein
MDKTHKARKSFNLSAYIVLMFAAGLSLWIYLTYQKNLDTQINIDYFRQISEAEDSLNRQLSRIKALIEFKDQTALNTQYNTYTEVDEQEYKCQKSTAVSAKEKLPSSEPIQKVINISNATIKNVIEAAGSGAKNQQDKPQAGNDGTSKQVQVTIDIADNGILCIQRKDTAENPTTTFASVALNELLSHYKNQFSDVLLANQNNQILASANPYGIHNILDPSDLIQQLQKEQQTSVTDSLFSKNQPKAEPDKFKIMQTSFTDTLLGGQRNRIFFHPITLDSVTDVKYYYLVATLPHSRLKNRDPIELNLPYLISGIFILAAIWVITSLWFYPRNKSLKIPLRKLSVFVLYALLVTCVSLAISQSAKLRLKEQREVQTKQLLQQLDSQLTSELAASVAELLVDKTFYENESAEDLNSYQLNPENKIPQHLLYNPNYLKVEHNEDYISAEQVPEHIKVLKIEMDSKKDGEISEGNKLKNESDAKAVTMAQAKPESPVEKAKSIALLGRDFTFSKPIKDKITRYNFPEALINTDGSLLFHLTSSFIINKSGESLLSISRNEKKLVTDNFFVSHRDYFKEIKRGGGWQLGNSDSPIIYLQRLHNIANGSLGSTISTSSKLSGQVIAADVFLHSTFELNPKQDSNIADAEIMIANHMTGEVLYHSDNNRSLKENLLTLNNARSQTFANWLSSTTELPLSGFYHGRSGLYFQTKFNSASVGKKNNADELKIKSPFTLVAFLPNTNVNAFATNHYIYLLVVFAILVSVALLVQMIVKLVCVRVNDESKGKVKFELVCTNWWLYFVHIPIVTVLVCLALLELLYYFGFYIGLLIFPIVLIIYSVRLYLGVNGKLDAIPKSVKQDVLSTKFLLSVLASLFFMTFILMSYQSAKGIFQQHQEQLYELTEQQNKEELLSFYREFYPNSLAYCIADDTCAWLKALQAKSPMETGDLTIYTKLRLYQNYLKKMWRMIHADSKVIDFTSNIGSMLLALLSLVMIAGWLMLYYYWARPRLHLSCGMKVHLNLLKKLNTRVSRASCIAKIHKNKHKNKQASHGLIILLGLTKRDGGSLEHDLQQITRYPYQDIAKHLKIDATAITQNSVPSLTEKSLPNLKGRYDSKHNKFELWDLEICLETKKTRDVLLSLIEYLKTLNKNNKLTIVLHCSSSTFHKLKWHDELQIELQAAQQQLFEPSVGHQDMLAWSECLMDFDLELDSSFSGYYAGLDSEIVKLEQQALPELVGLNINIPLASKVDEVSTAHTYSFLLHCFEATYRYKWENCNDREKLALYFLAKGHQINPQNKHLISMLAQKGLVVLHGNGVDLTLINETFKIFVRNAESEAVFKMLKRRGEAGTWTNFRVPFTLLILMAIIGLSLTSGQSIFLLLGGVSAALSSIASIRSNFGGTN